MKQTIKNLFRCTIALAALLITGTASADEVETFKITKAETTNGSFAVTVDGTAAEAAAAGATVTITATPSTGYEADGTPEVSVTTSWGKAGTRAEIPVEETITVTAGTTANTWTFTMPNDPVTVSMAFKQSGFAITVATGITGGTVAVSGDKTIARPGDEIALTNTPAEGYEFDSYSVKDADGKEVTVKDGKFTMPGSAVTVSAKFKKSKIASTGIAFVESKAVAIIGETNEFPKLSNPYNLPVEWISKNEDVATVDQKGQVTLVGPGVTEIWIVFKGNDQFDSVAAMYRLTVEGQPVIPDTSLPVITSQPENVTYAIGDTEYPKLRVEATTTVGELTYEWFIQSEDGTYLPSGIKTTELGLQAFIDNVVEISREEAAGDYIFVCKVSNANGTVESETATLTITAGGTAIATVKAGTQADSVRKYVKDGRIVIETAKGIFSLSGVQIR